MTHAHIGLQRWPAESIWEAIHADLPGFSVEILPQVDSTNSELMRRARTGRTEPILLVAEHQTAGKGRLGRQWHSEGLEGGEGTDRLASLTFSIGLHLNPVDWSGLSLAVGLSLVQSLHPDLRLKWPNDVWLGASKLAGILIETCSVGDTRYVVVGVGINLKPRSNDGLRTPATSLLEVQGGLVDAGRCLEQVAVPLVQAIVSFAETGFAPLQSAYQARDLLLGQTVMCSDGLVGIARGVDGSGALIVQTANGVKKITSAEVSVRPAAATSLA